MKKLIALMTGCFILATCFSQGDSSQPAFKRFPTFPPVQLLLPDSSSHFTKDQLPKKKVVILMIFNPACEHCQHETEEIVKNIDQFKNMQIVMATTSGLTDMKNFIETYHLDQYDNIIVGQDNKYFLPIFYMIRNLPFMAIYDKQGKLLDTMEGSRHIADIMKVLE
jgi:hypothetical protein